jgi:hypothetical protein
LAETVWHPNHQQLELPPPVSGETNTHAHARNELQETAYAFQTVQQPMSKRLVDTSQSGARCSGRSVYLQAGEIKTFPVITLAHIRKAFNENRIQLINDDLMSPTSRADDSVHLIKILREYSRLAADKCEHTK